MFGRVEIFGKTNAADFAARSQAGKRIAAIAQIIHDLDSAKAGQQPGRATVKDALLEALRQDLNSIVRTARAIAQDEPGFADGFHGPDSERQTALLTAVDAILLELTKPGIAAKFIAHEMPADFVKHLAADRQAVVNAQDAMEGDDHAGLMSTAAIDRLMRAGMKEVKYLDAIVRNKYAGNPDQLRAWESASTVARPARRNKKGTSTPTVDATPAAPTPTVDATPAAATT